MSKKERKKRTPKQGEIYWAKLDPTEGSEIQKTRPVVAISSDSMSQCPRTIVVPITGWKKKFDNDPRCICLEPTPKNGLTKKSVADVSHARSIENKRFCRKLGTLSDEILQQICNAVKSLI